MIATSRIGHISSYKLTLPLLYFIIIYTGIQGWIPTPRTSPVEEFLSSPTTKNEKMEKILKAPRNSPTATPSTTPSVTPFFSNAMTTTELRSAIAHEFNDNDGLPPEIPLKETIGKLPLMIPRAPHATTHPAYKLLQSYADNGCPVDCGPPWSQEHILLMLKRGPHVSAKQKDAKIQLHAETKDKINHGYARTVRWKDIKNKLPRNFKLSPIAMIPHKSKLFRAILDLSFKLRHKGKEYPSVNEFTNKLAKQEAMVQLGQTLKRIVALMADSYDPNQPFVFSKLDIKDGFWRMAVSDEDAWHFCYALPAISPNQPLDETTIVIPNSLQMGWTESPPYFCSGTETARDIIDELLTSEESLPKHIFEQKMLSNISSINENLNTTNTKSLLEVFVDDFIAATNNTNKPHLEKISRAMLHGIHAIFPPPNISGHNGYDPVSEKKLDQGEGTWSTKKEILGWEFDGDNYTITLPEKKCKAIITLIRKTLKEKKVTLNAFQKVAGKLQHASFGIPGGAGLFSPIQTSMAGDPPHIHINDEMKQILSDWRYIVHYMSKNPTSVLQLVVEYPDFVGYSDACGIGAGGVWSSGLKYVQPIMWQYEWPDDIKSALNSFDNPDGYLTINDLELAGKVMNWLVLECQPIDLAYHHIGSFCDNTSAVAWTHKMRTSKSKSAGRLLRMLGMRIHKRKASSITPLNIAGIDNDMADVVSRAFKNGKFFAAHKNLTHYFNSTFPLNQGKSWTEFTLPAKLASRVISCLRGELLPMEQLLRLPGIEINTGNAGANSQKNANATPSSNTSQALNESSSYKDLLLGSGRACTVAELKSKFRRSRMRSRPSPRPSNWLENQAPSIKIKKNKHTPSTYKE